MSSSTKSPPHSLNTLPAEILKRIASFSTCEAVLSLIHCSRYLYATCHDGHVYRSILLNRGNHPATSTQPWDISFLPATTTPTSTFARYALADSKARQWTAQSQTPIRPEEADDDDDTDDRQALNALLYLPHLAAREHPLTKTLSITHTIETFADLSRHPAYTPRINQLLTNTILTQFHPSQPPTSPETLSKDISVIIDTINYMSYHVGSYPDLTTVALVLLQYRLNNAHRMDVSTPLPSRIQSLNVIPSLPLPFEAVQMEAFGSAHLPMMVSEDFLQDGEWTGYYSYGRYQNATFDSPMKGVRFTTEAEGDSILNIRGKGFDNVGRFTLSGYVFSGGTVIMSKVYATGLSWDWNGSMTPWGILGYWGLGSSDEKGWFWLWKKEWSE